MNNIPNNIPSPCFVLEETLLRENLIKLSSVADQAGIEIIVALKGFAFWNSFPLIKKYLNSATASSLNEALLINEEMQCKAHTYAPVYSTSEIKEILGLSTHITFNSLSQWQKHKEIALTHKPVVSCGLRINPEYSEVGTDLYNPASPTSRLGIKASELSPTLPEGIEGLHFHLLCENNSFTLERTLEAVEQKFAHQLQQVKWLNLGGGHLITHKDYDTQHLIQLLKSFKSRYPNIETIILEPGSAIGWQTGFLLSSVEDIIEHNDLKIAMLDVSFAAHMPDCLEMPYKPTIRGATDSGDNQFKYRMGGNSCLAGDFMGMGDYFFETTLKPGDSIIFEDMIHYTMVKTTFFNGVKHPSIGVIDLNNKFRLLKSFSYNDYKNKLS